MLTCVDKFDIRKSTDRIAKYHTVLSFPISVCELGAVIRPTTTTLRSGTAKEPGVSGKCVRRFPTGLRGTLACTASGSWHAACNGRICVSIHRKVHVLKYRKVLR